MEWVSEWVSSSSVDGFCFMINFYKSNNDNRIMTAMANSKREGAGYECHSANCSTHRYATCYDIGFSISWGNTYSMMPLYDYDAIP